MYKKGVLRGIMSLQSGEKVLASQLGELGQKLAVMGHFIITNRGKYVYYKVKDIEAFNNDLYAIDGSFRDIEMLLSDNPDRASQALNTGGSKSKSRRSFNGFLVYCYDYIPVELSGQKFLLHPNKGSAMFVMDWKSFSVPADVFIIGIENCENYERIDDQSGLFMAAMQKQGGDSCSRAIFVSRYPLENSSADLRSWLLSIPNRYIHYGDFDLDGIKIFHNEYYKYLGERSSFLIPDDIELRLREKGSRERYDDQQRTVGISSPLPEVQKLIDLINLYKKGYDQEGYEKCEPIL